MKAYDLVRDNLMYLLKTEPGSFLDTVTAGQPLLKQGELIADFHAHPCIHSVKTLFDTLDVMVEHNVGLLAITIHHPRDEWELDFLNVKGFIEGQKLAEKLGYEDLGLAFSLVHRCRKLESCGLSLPTLVG